jgi:hypothetical protein
LADWPPVRGNKAAETTCRPILRRLLECAVTDFVFALLSALAGRVLAVIGTGSTSAGAGAMGSPVEMSRLRLRRRAAGLIRETERIAPRTTLAAKLLADLSDLRTLGKWLPDRSLVVLNWPIDAVAPSDGRPPSAEG